MDSYKFRISNFRFQIPEEDGHGSPDLLRAAAEVGAGGGEIAGLEGEADLVEELAVEAPVDPGKLGDLVVGSVGGEDGLDDPEQVALELLREGGDGQPGDDVIGLRDTSIGQDAGQVSAVALDDVEVAPRAEP